MRTDRELLELAAKASGNTVFSSAGLGVRSVQHWNPLEDDGDCLRLAHQLGLRIHWFGTLAEVRRAIVRAAAEIGAAM